ncbi:hypothetical protein LTS17_005292 [Exophiala oligosperma]
MGMNDTQDLQASDFLGAEDFDADAVMNGMLHSLSSNDPSASAHQMSTLTDENNMNSAMGQGMLEQFPEPDWINQFDFSVATYSSVFQTALPLWSTITWSPSTSSLIQPPQSPDENAKTGTLHKTLPTPGSGQRDNFTSDRPEGALPLLDRVFAQSSRIGRPGQDHQNTIASQTSHQVTAEIRNELVAKLNMYAHLLPSGFVLPSHHALNRYTTMYFDAGAQHQPFIHEPTWCPRTCNIGLCMAVWSLGSRYCFEEKMSKQLWNVGKAIVRSTMDETDQRTTDLSEQLGNTHASQDLLQTCQALLLLMMYGTWAGGKHFLRQALAMQSGLAALVREINPRTPPEGEFLNWKDWVEYEAEKRTKFVVFCFFNLQCLTYDLPALILHNELNLELPCGEELWRASSSAAWTARRQQDPNGTPPFQQVMKALLDEHSGMTDGTDSHPPVTEMSYSIFGSYILINGLTQHSSELRRYAHSMSGHEGDLNWEQTKSFEKALRRWQKGWENHPKASLDPHDPHGPLAFNCTALLRMAYIRLEIDLAPYAAALRSGDPQVVAQTMYDAPHAKRSRRSMRAALHAWHALLIPTRMGIDLVAQTQVFLWSIQHFIASFECCLLLAKWLDSVTVECPSPPMTEEERWLVQLVQETLREAGSEAVDDVRTLSSSVLTTWARLFYGNKIWGILPLIGQALTRFAELLSNRSLPGA